MTNISLIYKYNKCVTFYIYNNAMWNYKINCQMSILSFYNTILDNKREFY